MLKHRIKEMLNNMGCRDAEKIWHRIKDYEVISFDIFDTLVKRTVGEPEAVFLLMEQREQLPNFCQCRIEAEKVARKQTATGEVTLSEIYEAMHWLDADERERLKNLEKQLEIEVAVANEILFSLYQRCISEGKRIIIITDMYLDRETITQILGTNGITGYERLYISQELGQSKNKGDLFAHVKEDMKNSSIIHIGNAFRSDYWNAIRCGIKSVKIPTR